MTTTRTRLTIKHAMTASAYAYVQAREVWKAYFRGLRDEWRNSVHG
jgi:hypothetical protein